MRMRRVGRLSVRREESLRRGKGKKEGFEGLEKEKRKWN